MSETTTRQRTPFEQTVREILDMPESNKTEQTAKMGRLASVLIKQEGLAAEAKRKYESEEKLLRTISQGFERVSGLMVGKDMVAANQALAAKDDEIATLRAQLAAMQGKDAVSDPQPDKEPVGAKK